MEKHEWELDLPERLDDDNISELSRILDIADAHPNRSKDVDDFWDHTQDVSAEDYSTKFEYQYVKCFNRAPTPMERSMIIERVLKKRDWKRRHIHSGSNYYNGLFEKQECNPSNMDEAVFVTKEDFEYDENE